MENFNLKHQRDSLLNPAIAIVFVTFLVTTSASSSKDLAEFEVATTTVASPEQIAGNGLEPQKTWLFAVGILTFSDNVSWGSSNRRDSQIVSIFRKRGLPKDHVEYISDGNGTLANIKEAFRQFLQGTQEGDFLIHYYTGHGDVGLFETTNGGSYNHAWIAREIATKFRGSQALLLGDCCDSGSLEDVVTNASGPIGYACLSSSSRNESGNGNWTFSQAVLDALRGEPYVDLDKDGWITIDEMAAHVKHDIAFYERNHSVYRKSPSFDGKKIVAKTKSTKTKEPKPVEVWYEGKWWKAKLLESNADQGHIRWIQLGYDSADQDVWVDLDNIRPLNRLN